MTDPEIFRSSENPEENSWPNRSGRMPLKTRLMLWGLVIGGIGLGTFLFLFFITVFIYLFLPLMIILFLWNALQRFRG